MRHRRLGRLGLTILALFAAACAGPDYFPPGTFVLGSDKISQAVFERNFAAMNEPSLQHMNDAKKVIRVSWFYAPEWNSTLRIVEMENGEVLSVFRRYSFREESDRVTIVPVAQSETQLDSDEFARLLSELERWRFRSLDHRQETLVIGGATLLVEFNDGGLYHAVKRDAPYPEDPVRRIAELAEEIANVPTMQ